MKANIITAAICTFYILSGRWIAASGASEAERVFIHPGITYTQGDFDRMRAMVAAGREPWASAFQALLNSGWSSLGADVVDHGTAIGNGQQNATIGRDGRRAHDLALIWKLTDDERYARKAVEYLNANSHYADTGATGTPALDNGKIFLLVEAAEMLRDWPGWAQEDQARFREMLLAPNCFMYHIRNFDCGRFGNQGLMAARGMVAIGIYLDDSRIYERAIRYLKGEKHRADDDPYMPGPPLQGWQKEGTEYQKEWHWHGKFGDIEDYGYDEQIQHYIHPNGQCQESSRDQGHTCFGVNMLASIAEVAWNQGDDLYSFLDNRILLGLEWAFRYNLSAVRSYPDQPEPWQPTGFTEDPSEATFENGKYLQALSRSKRWQSIKPTDDRGDKSGSGGSREAALAHYKIRAGLAPEKYLWLERYRDYMIETSGMENWGVGPNWFYEWCGWGTLTKRRTSWMAGDPRRTVGGVKVSGAHPVPGDKGIRWEDFDYYPGDGNGKTYKRANPSKLSKGDWNAYTLTCAEEGDYNIDIYYTASGNGKIAASVDKGKVTTVYLLRSYTKVGKATMKKVHIQAGACVLRLAIADAPTTLKIVGFQIRK